MKGTKIDFFDQKKIVEDIIQDKEIKNLMNVLISLIVGLYLLSLNNHSHNYN